MNTTVTRSGEKLLKGISASPGICIGKAYLVDKEGVDVVERYLIPESAIRNEVKRFKAAVKKSIDELSEIIEKTPEDFLQQASILETQQVLLKDKMLYGRTIETIEAESVNAEWALKKVSADVRSTFMNMTDPYLRERAEDISHLADRIMRNLVGAEQVDIGRIYKRVILVAHDLSPAETSQIQLDRIKGFVTDKGGKASHTGIIARTLEIPAVLGIINATASIKNEDVIIVDGTAGQVIVSPDEKTLVEYEERSMRYEQHKAAITRKSRRPARTTDGRRVKIMGNIELSEEVVSAINYGAEGIGLYRTEFQYMGRSGFPSENELYEKYSDVIDVMAAKPVTIRTLDVNGDKAISPENGQEEENPALGLRGIRYCLQRPDVFIPQLRAILRAAARGNVRIMIPMITTCEEIIQTKQLLSEVAEALDKEGAEFDGAVKIGALIEVPSAVIMADKIAEEIDFFSIGTNDLIQYTLAIDRGNRHVSHLFRPLDPAVLRMLKRITDVAAEKDKAVSICGEMAGYAIHAPILLGLGMDEMSMNPQAIPTVKEMIRSIKMADTGPLVEEALRLASAEKTFDLLQEAYGSVLAEIERAE